MSVDALVDVRGIVRIRASLADWGILLRPFGRDGGALGLRSDGLDRYRSERRSLVYSDRMNPGAILLR